MASNLKAQLEKCIGDVEDKGFFDILSVTKAPFGEDHWFVRVSMKGVAESIEILVSAEDDSHRIRMDVSFDLDGYTEPDKARCLDVVNQINNDAKRITHVVLDEGERGVKGIVRVSFGYHPFYLDEAVLDELVGFFKMNILALAVETESAVISLRKAISHRGKYLS